ncbi:MAG TPA: GGDEF domain-containing protein [Burkholderiales bacterium]|nr:GGDEF domain-containing protein [Burkholderiales bacterium]
MHKPALHIVLSLAISVAAVLLAQVLATHGPALPATLSGLRVYGPYAAFVLAGVISLWFGRGRAFLALLCIAIGYAAYLSLLDARIQAPEARTAFAALCVFVPANLALFSLLSERGLFTVFGLRRLLVIATEIVFTFWLIAAGVTGFAQWVAEPVFDSAWLQASPIPQGALLVMLLSLLVVAVRALSQDTSVDAAMAGALVAFGLASHNVAQPNGFALFVSCAALLLLIGVLQDSRRMAFRDELTGLPSRRALNERLMRLGHDFTIAMLDVDHFKQFNDTYGHDVGDHVLRMVAAELGRVRRGGRAFRYGGEEFALVFPGRGVRQVIVELESVRASIAQHRVALRSADRPTDAEAGRSLRAGRAPRKLVSVTISIGVAESNEKLRTPDDVIKAADRALYRAKEKGRNTVSR